jgi:hypothetical protein
MDFFRMYLRIKSKIRKIINTKPMYNIFPSKIEINKATHTVKQVMQETSLRKNFSLKEFVKDLLIKRYSI